MEHQSTCPLCGATFPVPAEFTVTTVQCPDCGHSFQTIGRTAVNESDAESEAAMQDTPSDPARPSTLLIMFKVFGFLFVMLVCAAITAAVGGFAGNAIGLTLHPKRGHMDFGFRKEGEYGFWICGIAGFVLPLVILILIKKIRRKRL